MSKILTVYNFKGGVGKTITTYQLAKHLAQRHQVLLIDCDPQCNLSTLMLRGKSYPTDIFQHIKSHLHHRPSAFEPFRLSKNLSIIPGSQHLIDLESNNHFIEFGSSIVQSTLRDLEADFDFILIDCPSYFGKLVKNILSNSDHLLVPLTPDVFSIKGAVKLLKSLKSLEFSRKLSVLGTFFNRYRTNSRYHRKIREIAARVFGQFFIPDYIRNSAQLNDSLLPLESGIGGSNLKTNSMDKDFQSLFDKIQTKIFPPPIDFNPV